MIKNLNFLLDKLSDISKETDIRKIILKYSNLIVNMLEAQRCSIFLYDKDTKKLYTYYADCVDKIIIDANLGVVGKCFQENKILNIKDAYSCEFFDKSFDEKFNFKTKSLLCVPLKSKRKRIGVFEVINKIGNKEFSDEEIKFLKHISMNISNLLENHFLYKELEKSEEEIIYRLSAITKYKDSETQNHIIRVAKYSELLGNLCGLSKTQTKLLKLASPMHDIGKVGIPDNILKKPDKLTQKEWEVMKKHTIYGYEILKNSDSKLLQIASIIALEHHEKWNGSGYPNCKKGEEISIYARILSVVDVFDALYSKRRYKNPWSKEKIIEFFKKESGQIFDPKLTKLFLENIDKFIEIRNKLKD